MGAWRLKRVVADHGHEFDKIDDSINNTKVENRKRCTYCWNNNKKIHKEDEEHVLFKCPKYNEIRKSTYEKLTNNVSQAVNSSEINEHIEGAWWVSLLFVHLVFHQFHTELVKCC